MLKSDSFYEQGELAQWYKLLMSLISSNVESEALDIWLRINTMSVSSKLRCFPVNHMNVCSSLDV